MATIEQRCLIHSDLETAFHASQDYACRHLWDPFTRNIERDDKDIVKVTAWNGLRMKVEYVSRQPPERAAIRMVEGPSILGKFAGCWIFSQHSPNAIEVRFRYQVHAVGILLALEPVIVIYFKWETRRRLNGLKRYLERSKSMTASC